MKTLEMETCPFCGTQIIKGLLGFHYAGYRCEPCVSVERAFGPDGPHHPTGPKGDYPLPDEWAPRGANGRTAAQVATDEIAASVPSMLLLPEGRQP